MNHYEIKRGVAAFFLLLPLHALLQTRLPVADSVQRYLLTAKPDTNKCYLLLQLTQPPVIEADSVLQYAQQYYNWAVQQNITTGRPEALYTMGVGFYRKGRNNEAIEKFYKAAAAWDSSRNNPLQLARTYELIAGIHKTLEGYSDALDYYYRSLRLKAQQNNEPILLSTYNGLGNTYRLLNNSDSAIFYLTKAFTLAQGNTLAMAQVSNNLGNIYWTQKNFPPAVEWYNQALRHFTTLRHAAGIAEVNFNLGAVATQQAQYQQAIGYYTNSLQAAPTGQPLEHLEWTYQHLADAYFKTGKPALAYTTVLKYGLIKDSSLNLNLQKSIAGLKEKYETEKKEHALAMEQVRANRLQIINTNQVLLIYILVGVTLLIVGMGYGLLRNMRRKQLLAAELAAMKEKEKQQLIQEQALKNSVAMLEGRELERQRISRDLHDRVGSSLSSVNLLVQRMKGEDAAVTDATNKIELMLNDTIDDVRRISHDLSDRILQQYGLAEALKDLRDTAAAGGMEVELHQQAVAALPAHLEAEIYYICRELVTNANKHSEATHLSIQLMQDRGQLYVTVEDNGKGFNPAQLHEGIGLSNIKTRANNLQAQLSIDSKPGRGTCISLIIPITSLN